MKLNLVFFKNLFLVAAVYDFILGILFVFFYQPIFTFFNIAIPNYPEYLQLAAAFVVAMGVGYYFVYQNMSKNIDIVKLGIVYKAIYSGFVTYYYINGAANFVFLVFAIIDFIFMLFFIWYLGFVKK